MNNKGQENLIVDFLAFFHKFSLIYSAMCTRYPLQRKDEFLFENTVLLGHSPPNPRNK